LTGKPNSPVEVTLVNRLSYREVPELIEAITTWGSAWNDDPSPFIWQATADEIIEKVQRGRAALNRQTNSKTEHYSKSRLRRA
jgi:hypothetical protein